MTGGGVVVEATTRSCIELIEEEEATDEDRGERELDHHIVGVIGGGT